MYLSHASHCYVVGAEPTDSPCLSVLCSTSYSVWPTVCSVSSVELNSNRYHKWKGLHSFGQQRKHQESNGYAITMLASPIMFKIRTSCSYWVWLSQVEEAWVLVNGVETWFCWRSQTRIYIPDIFDRRWFCISDFSFLFSVGIQGKMVYRETSDQSILW